MPCAMYVLVEAYQSSPPSFAGELRRLVPSEASTVADLLTDSARIDALRDIRDYMSHRDLRRYYDVGRLAVASVGLQWFQSLEEAFGAMLLGGIRAAHLERSAGVPVPVVGDDDA